MAPDPHPADDPPTPAPRRDPPPEYGTAGHLVHASWSGPLPPPAQLRQYEEAHAGLAERIVVVFEEQMAQRHRLELRLLKADAANARRGFAERRRGQYLAFLICLAATVGGTWAAIVGRQVAGSVIGGTGLAGLAAAFIYGRVAGGRGK